MEKMNKVDEWNGSFTSQQRPLAKTVVSERKKKTIRKVGLRSFL
jgi:hypothetical protein